MCKDASRRIYPRGMFKLKDTLYNLLDEAGIAVPVNMRFYPYVCTYDCESLLLQQVDIPSTSRTSYSHRHELVSISVASNVPGFETPVCIVREVGFSTYDVVNTFIDYITEISEAANLLLIEQYEEYRSLIDDEQLEKRFDTYMSQIPVIGFNSGSYDLNILKPDLIPILHQRDPETFVIKRGSNYMTISTSSFRFLDILFYLAPGFNYEQFIKAYGAEAEKGYFPYEFMDSLEKLNSRIFPEYHRFYSVLKQVNVLEAEHARFDKLIAEGKSVEAALGDMNINEIPQTGIEKYQDLVTMFYQNNWSMKDYLVWYNNKGLFILIIL